MFTKNTAHGILWMVVRCFIFSLQAISYSKATNILPVAEVFFMSTVIRLFMTLPAIPYTRGKILKTKKPRFFVMRAAITTLGHLLWIYALTVVPINEATAISFTAPLFTSMIAIMFLGEKISLKRSLAIFVGFLGVMVIKRPDLYGVDSSAMIVLGMAVIWAITDTIIKMQTNSESVGGQLFHNSLLMACFSAPFAMSSFQMPSNEAWGWLTLSAVLALLNNMTIFISYGKADLSIVAPFTFTRLIFTAIFSYALLNQSVTDYQIIGSGIIIASSVYITKLEVGKKNKVETS